MSVFAQAVQPDFNDDVADVVIYSRYSSIGQMIRVSTARSTPA